MRLDRTRHLDDLNRQLDRARQTLGGLTFTCRDLFDHLDAVADDPKTLVSLNPPTITAGYETFYNTDGRVRWHQPPYEVFDPVEGHARLEQYLARNALLSIYVERPQTDRAVMARGSFRKGPGDTGVARSMNWYITSNRPDELRDYLGGFLVVPWDGYAVARGDYQIVQPDHVITSDSTVQIVPMRDEQANYYRLLWTHRFVGAHARINLAMLVDGYLAGVFGYDPAYLSSAGAYGKDANALAIIYGMTPHYTARRLNRLLSRLALTRDAIRLVLSSVMLSRCEMLVTAQMSPYPESKEYRGIMTLEKRKKDPVHGYRLIYTAPIVEQSWPDVFATWIKDEDRWRNARAKHRAAQAAHSSV